MTMPEPGYTRLIMLGTAFETRGGIAAVVNAYRAQGLFERWPIDYVATHCDGGAVRKLLTAVRALLRLVFLLAKHRRVVMHVHCASRASFWRKSVFMAVGMLANCPFILHLHGAEFVRFYEAECGKVKRRTIRYFLDRAACVIVLSAWWRAWITGITQNPRLACIANPAPTVDERAALRRDKVVLFLGRLDQRKGIFDLLDAVSALRASIPGIRLVCAGDGDLESVVQYAKRLGIADAVSVPGWVGPAEKPSLMNRAAVFVLPSYAEGLPMSLLEAMAAGLPVVATEVGGIPDVVTDGVNGFLFRPGDSATLERLLRRLMHDPQLGMRIGTAARETVGLRFSADRVFAQLDEIYAGLGLARSAGARACMPARPLRGAA
jgi:glycosyltransferase involved in cell wall biosynthesis